MSGNEIDREILENESKKMEARSLLNSLYFLNGSIANVEESISEGDELAVRDWLINNYAEIDKLSGLLDLLVSSKKIDQQVKHDLNNIATSVLGYLSLYADAANNGGKIDLNDLMDNVVSKWNRFAIGATNILLRILSEDTIPPEFNNGLNIDAIHGAIKYFSKNELSKIREFSHDSGSAYKEIDGKTINFVPDDDWDKIKSELGDRQVAGESGLIGNFVLNALRNSFKDKVEAEKISLKIKIVGNEFVIRVEDDGNGISINNLTPNKKTIDKETGKEKSLFIFDSGVSATGSTGIGLANFHTLLKSVGGKLYVVTRDKSMSSNEEPTRYQYGSTAEEAKTVNFNNPSHGTVFEIRLPITKKAA